MSKEFLIIGNGNAVTYKAIIEKIKKNELRLGVTKGVGGHFWMIANKEFKVIDASTKEKDGNTLVDISLACWLTNMKNERGKEELDLSATYTPTEYHKYDNYDAIEVGKVNDIPKDYYGVMGVPFSFMDKWCPAQFQILGVLNPKLKGKWKYKRLLIKRKIKKFLILGNNNAITYKEIFPYIKNNELWLGFSANKTMKFQLSDSYEKFDEMDKNRKKYGKVPAITWFTNIPHNKRNKPLDLYRKYNPTDYPKYDNYDAIEVSKVAEIPEDYNGVMGVPITFLDKYCPTQFEIVGTSDRGGDNQINWLKNQNWDGLWDSPFVNGNKVYKRLFIKRVKNNETKEI